MHSEHTDYKNHHNQEYIEYMKKYSPREPEPPVIETNYVPENIKKPSIFEGDERLDFSELI